MVWNKRLARIVWSGAAAVGVFWRGSQAIAQSPSIVPVAQSPQLTPPQPIPDAVINPIEGKVTVKLINTTETEVVYQAYGQIEPQTLLGRSNITLTALDTPANLNFYRPDRGFLIVTLNTSTPDTLEVTLTRSADQGQGSSSLVVNPRGEVYVF